MSVKQPFLPPIPSKMSQNLALMASELLHFPKNFRHLGLRDRSGSFVNGRYLPAKRPSKFTNANNSTRVGGSAKAYVQPRDRIKKFSIHPGDKVRLISGRDEHMYNDEVSRKSGWKLYTVKNVDRERNRVYLEGLVQKKSSQPRPKPLNFDSLSEAERTKWQESAQIPSPMKPVHYSKVSLLVEENTANEAGHVFASRLRAGEIFEVDGQPRWKRYATKITGRTNLEPEDETGRINIPWPEKVHPPKPIQSELDVAGPPVTDPTLILPTPSDLRVPQQRQTLARIFPLTLRSPPPTDQTVSDTYINEPARRKDVHSVIDAFMPLYLSEELSPRFAKNKVAEAWRQRKALERTKRDTIGDNAVQQWDDAGRDTGLREIMDSDEAGLEGVPLRPRTIEEVREAAWAEHDEEFEAERKVVKRSIVAGMKWDQRKRVWIPGEKGYKLARKQAKKKEKAMNLEKKMKELKLRPGKNMVLPPDLHGEESTLRAIDAP